MPVLTSARLVRSLRTTPLAVANFLTALVATFAFKLALFAYSVSGAEGSSSALLTWPRLLLCLGWDVVSAALIAALVTLVAAAVAGPLPRLALAWSMVMQAT